MNWARRSHRIIDSKGVSWGYELGWNSLNCINVEDNVGTVEMMTAEITKFKRSLANIHKEIRFYPIYDNGVQILFNGLAFSVKGNAKSLTFLNGNGYLVDDEKLYKKEWGYVRKDLFNKEVFDEIRNHIGQQYYRVALEYIQGTVACLARFETMIEIQQDKLKEEMEKKLCTKLT